MKYTNPVIFADYSDPDVIRRGDSFYLVASSFNHTPGVPVLKSKNLVDWKLLNYVFEEIPFPRFKNVCHGDGAWAPSIRYHNGLFYVIIPFPDEGIYVSCTDNIEQGKWSAPWCLIPGRGIEDPCPIWVGDKCYLAVAFVKSRIGFNSMLGLYEVTPDLKHKLSDYKIIFDGHNTQPTIEGPKFYAKNGYFYIMAPAGSVKSGWQVCLRSRNIYGPYEEKIVLMQNDSRINGPHQGALIDIGRDKWAFMHFQDMASYGRVVHLQPVRWINDWPVCGEIKDELLAGTPYQSYDYLIEKKSNFSIPASDSFKGSSLSLIWQTPANKSGHWYDVDNGLTLYCVYHNDRAYKALNLTPNLFLTKIALYSFTVRTACILDLVHEGDEVGFCYMGSNYQYICIKKLNGQNHLQLRQGYFNQDNDIVLFDSIYKGYEIEFMMKYSGPDTYQLGFNKSYLKHKFTACPGRWIGGKYGIYAKGLKTGGKAIFKYFTVKRVK